MVNRTNARKIRLIRVSGYDLLGLSGCLAVSIPRRPFNGTLRIARGRYTTRKRGCHLEETRRTWYGITWRVDRWQTVVFMVLLNILRVLKGLNIIPLKGEVFSLCICVSILYSISFYSILYMYSVTKLDFSFIETGFVTSLKMISFEMEYII